MRRQSERTIQFPCFLGGRRRDHACARLLAIARVLHDAHDTVLKGRCLPRRAVALCQEFVLCRRRAVTLGNVDAPCVRASQAAQGLLEPGGSVRGPLVFPGPVLGDTPLVVGHAGRK